MDLAFIFTYLILRCLRSEVEICALSISIRHKALGALGLPVAALTGVENSKGEIASIAVKNAIGSLSGLKSAAMFEDGKSQGSPEKVIHTGQKWRRCPDQRTASMWQGFLGNQEWRRIGDLNP